jgi:hypothetical protein
MYIHTEFNWKIYPRGGRGWGYAENFQKIPLDFENYQNFAEFADSSFFTRK